MDFDNYKKIKQLEVQHEADVLALKEADEIIAELEGKIEKLKCCGNCKHCNIDAEPFCTLLEEYKTTKCEKWEQAE